MTDIVFISPDSSREVYQGLAERYSAIEPPVWCLLLAGALRDKYSVAIVDPLAERLSDEAAYKKVMGLNPRYICFVVYGQNPNSGSTNMAGAVRLARLFRGSHIPVIAIGPHASALPEETLDIDKPNYIFDYVCPGDGLDALKKILDGDQKWRGVYWSKPSTFSSYAWDLLPPLSNYRAHLWHCNFDETKRSPFASIYTSLGCPFKCDFCMINMVNRESPEQLDAAQASGIRFFDPGFVLDELEYLYKAGVKNVRIQDEMFFLNKLHYVPILTGIIDRGLNLNLWAYARVDTVRPEYLGLFKTAGVNWLCLGIESANQMVRREASKGSFETVDVRQIVKEIKDAGINVLANFIFGLPDEDEAAMQETLDLALEINAEHTNFYPCMALPGTPLYRQAVKEGTAIPQTFSGFSFHSEDCLPLPTKHCTPQQVLAFRDMAWEKMSLSPPYLEMIDRKFGTADAIRQQAKIKLKRSILDTR